MAIPEGGGAGGGKTTTKTTKYQFKKRTNTSYSAVKDVEVMGMQMYKTPNPFTVGSSGGNCTWWAWGRFREVAARAGKKIQAYDGPTGNASHFYNQCSGKFKRGTTPKVGSIICWGYGSSTGGDGHVAFVEYVYSNGDIEISHSGWSSGPLENERLSRGDGKKGFKAYHRSYGNTYFNGFIYNPVEFKNPDGTDNTVAGVPSDSTTARTAYISKYGNEARVYFSLRDEGLSHKAACAIMGNMRQESNFNPTVVNSIGATGLCQWYAGRCTNMKKFNSGYSWKNIKHQIKYLMYELKGSYKAKVYDVLTDNSKTLKDMTYAFLRWFEIPGNYDTEINRRYPFAQTYYARYKNAGKASATTEVETRVVGYDMQKRASQLSSSDNYEYLQLGDAVKQKEKEEQIKQIAQISSALKTGLDTGAIPEAAIIKAGVDLTTSERVPIVRHSDKFSLSDALIQAPFIEADFGGYVIGSVKGNLDPAPNYISQLDIRKINGEINQYTLQIVYQIRPGEDPNKLDKLFSTVRYNKIKLRYGDCASEQLFVDTEAVITNVTQNRDYTSARISYTVYATSACNYVTSVKFNYPARSAQPSSVIEDLLYRSEASQLLLEAFPGMSNSLTVASNNWIPKTDAVVEIPAQDNLDALSYLSYLVSIMSNKSNGVKDVIRSSTYYLSYQDDAQVGSHFKITEIPTAKSGDTSKLASSIFDVTIGYPDGNDVFAFNVTSDNSWSLLYNLSTPSSEFVYTIDNDGNQQSVRSPNYFSSSQEMNEIQKNWWTQMTEFPVSAQLVIKGLLKPIKLMDLINVDVRFYGVKHLTSGLYAITGQQDVLDGSGFKTNLALLRVGDISTPYVPLSRPEIHVERKPGNVIESAFAMIEEHGGTEKEQIEFTWNLEKLKEVVANPPVTITTTTQPPSSTSEGRETSTSEKESSTSSSIAYSYQFSGIGKTYTLTGDKFKSSNKKVATVNKDGVVTSKGAGKCIITVTKNGKEREVSIRVPKEVSRKTVLQPWWDAQKVQQEWSWNARYDWTRPTIQNSKTQGTCITMPSVSAQRCHLITSRHFLTASSGTGTREYQFAVREATDAMQSVNKKYWWRKYYINNPKPVKSLIKSGDILEGDILHSWKHTWIYYGRDKHGNFLWNESGHAGSGRRDNGPGANRTALRHTNPGNTNANCIGIYRINIFKVATTCKNGTITGSREWMAGQNVKIEYKPRKGYKLSKLTVDGKKWSIKKHPKSVTFKKIDEKHTVNVEFVKE